MNAKIGVAALLCLWLSRVLPACGQGLKVGDRLPPAFWQMPLEVAGGKPSIRLREDGGQLILLDFWATWCGPCIRSLSRLDSLQREFGPRLLVLPVSSDPPEKTLAFMAKRKLGLPPVAANDSLNAWFPHRYIPHYVWIHGGAVAAITGSGAVSRRAVGQLLDGGGAGLSTKDDRTDFDHRRPLFLEGNAGDGSQVKYHSLLSGPIAGLNRMQSVPGEGATGLHSRIFAINCTVPELYRMALGAALSLPANRIVLQVSEPPGPVRQGKKGSLAAMEKEDTYCYELLVPPQTAGRIRAHMLADLDRYLGLRGGMEERPVDCYELRAGRPLGSSGAAPEANIYDPRASRIRIVNRPITVLAEYLNNHLPRYVIDSTGLKAPVDLSLPNMERAGFDLLEKSLRAYGLRLVPVKRTLPVLVIRDGAGAEP